MCSSILLVVLSLWALECPAGTELKQRTTADARESWCEKPRGVRHGPRHAWHSNDSKWFEGMYTDGKRSGVWRFWFHDGAKRSESAYADDRRHGDLIQWHENGTVHLKGACREGVEHGPWERFRPNGSKEVHATFAKGKLESAQYWSRRGLPITLGEFVSEMTRGRPGNTRYDRVLVAYEKNAGFDACGE